MSFALFGQKLLEFYNNLQWGVPYEKRIITKLRLSGSHNEHNKAALQLATHFALTAQKTRNSSPSLHVTELSFIHLLCQKFTISLSPSMFHLSTFWSSQDAGRLFTFPQIPCSSVVLHTELVRIRESSASYTPSLAVVQRSDNSLPGG